MIYCTQCGNENEETSKFCRNCGAKLQPSSSQAQDAKEDGETPADVAAPVYEKITDAEEEKPAPILSQEEIKTTPYMGTESRSYGSSANMDTSPYYDTQSSQYYSADQNEKQRGGNIGFAIASLVCGILSLVCCCLTLFSAVMAIAAVVLGMITLCAKYDGKGMAIAGIITGGIGILVVVIVLFIGGSPAYNELLKELEYEFY